MNMKDERPQTRYEMRRPAAPSPVTPPRSRDLRREREASPDRQTRTET